MKQNGVPEVSRGGGGGSASLKLHMGVSKNRGDDLGVPLFSETSIFFVIPPGKDRWRLPLTPMKVLVYHGPLTHIRHILGKWKNCHLLSRL